jgi:hypothetical protein
MHRRINKRILLTAFLYFFTALLLTAQNSAVQKYGTTNLYAGLEVGSKGVKLSLIELLNRETDDADFKILKDTTINTDFISFTQPTYQATLNAMNILYDVASKQHGIPAGNIFAAISSGVHIQAEKEEKLGWIDQLINSFKYIINEPDRKVTVIDIKEEARLSHLGIIPESRRYKTFLIDIGSGNTKGGYFPFGDTKTFKLFELSWGTKSVANAAEKILGNDKSTANYTGQLTRVLDGAEEKEIVYAVNLSGAFPKSDNIAFSGGIAWAVANLIAPELNENSVIPVSYAEVFEFSEKLAKNPGLYSDQQIVKDLAPNTADPVKTAKDVKQVHRVFDQRSLLSGTGLMLKIMRQFDGVFERKQFFLVKNGSVGWISAFVNLNAGK